MSLPKSPGNWVSHSPHHQATRPSVKRSTGTACRCWQGGGSAAARFGPGFAAAVFEAGPGGWSGPVASAYGYHLVLVTRRTPARVPDFAEVAGRIATDLDAARRAGALDRIYAQVRDAYQVEIEPPPASPPARASHPHGHAERTRA